MAEINDLNVTDASNTARWPEGMAPSAVNNAGRADEGILARWHKDTNASVASTGSANAYVVAANQTISAYYDGLVIAFDANFANTAAATLNVDAVGADTIKKHGATDLAANDIKAGQKVIVIHDGTNWQMVSPLGNTSVTASASNTFTADQTIAADLTVSDTDAGALEGPVVKMYRNSASPAASDILAALTWSGNDSAVAEFRYAAIYTTILTATAGSEDSRMEIDTRRGGALSRFTLEKGALALPNATGGIQSAEGSLNAAEIYDDGNQVHVLQDGLGTFTAASSTAVDFTGIRSDARRITVMFDAVSLSGTDEIEIQLGDSGGFETSGYTGIAWRSGATSGAWSTGMLVNNEAAAASAFTGQMIITLADSATNLWIGSGLVSNATAGVSPDISTGSKALSAVLTQVRIKPTGSDTFDAGNLNILVE
jgi:hypothetical protein